MSSVERVPIELEDPISPSDSGLTRFNAILSDVEDRSRVRFLRFATSLGCEILNCRTPQQTYLGQLLGISHWRPWEVDFTNAARRAPANAK